MSIFCCNFAADLGNVPNHDIRKKRLWRFVLANWNLANFKVFTQNITAQDAPNVYIYVRACVPYNICMKWAQCCLFW